jgi:hypothetical protein
VEPVVVAEFQAAAARTTNVREQHYLTMKAARLSAGSPRPGSTDYPGSG